MSLLQRVEDDLVHEVRLEPVQARVYLLVTCYGKMSPQMIAAKLDISETAAKKASQDLIELGAFINISDTEFEAMHPRFTAVNMYRRTCVRQNIPFKRNSIVDNIGVVLENPYDDARTK